MTTSGRSQDDEAKAESALTARAREGDQDAFADLVKLHQGLVFRIVGSMLRNRADVEDVAQDAFLRAFTAMPGFRPGAPFAPWIARIATRLCYDRLRQRGRRGEVAWDEGSLDQQGGVLAVSADRDVQRSLAARDLAERALARLPVKDRQVLVLTDALGFSPGEVAGMMGASAVAVRVRLHRARRALRRLALELLGETEKE
jgi:RNA polymerase sigma-70 factor (ECF subfamily)